MRRKIVSAILIGSMLAAVPALAADDVGSKIKGEVSKAEKGTANYADQIEKGAKKQTKEIAQGTESFWEKVKKMFGSGGGKKE